MVRHSLEIEERLGRQEGIASDYGNLGVLHSLREEYAEAEEMYRKSLEISVRLGSLESVGRGYFNLGLVFQQQHALDRAEEHDSGIPRPL